MSLRKNSEIDSIDGGEGTRIKRYFDPHDTLNGTSYSLAQFVLNAGERSKPHKLRSTETYYILEGTGTLHVDSESYDLERDDSVYVPSNSRQFIENSGSGKLRFLCIVEPAWKADDESLLE